MYRLTAMNKFLLTLFLIGFIGLVQAQSGWQNLAIQVGYSQSAQSPSLFRADQVTAWAHNIHSIYFGAEYADSINRHWGWSIGIHTCEKGYKTQFSSTGSLSNIYLSYQYSLRCLELPICATFNLGGFQIKGGLFTTYLFGSNYMLSETDQNSTLYLQNKFVATDNSHYNKWDFGIHLGIVRRINSHFDIELNVERGFLFLDKSKGDEIKYQETGLIGIRYFFLKPSKYLTDVSSSKNRTFNGLN
jgi:hypothetical protein